MKAGQKLRLSSLAILLIAGAAGTARAADNKGFQPGPRTFSNPFANQPKQDMFPDEEDDEEFDDSGSKAKSAARPGAGGGSAGGAQANNNQPQGVSLGGGPPGGVVSKDKISTLDINTMTGEGSKEVVTDFNFPDADILDIAKALGKLTGKNFILDKDVKGRITIISNGPITVGDAWKAFLTALDINQFALIPSGNFIRIARQRDARDKQLKTYTGDYSPDTDALITRVFPLKYINAEEVARTFRSFMPANSRIIPYDQTNTVIVTDTGSNIAKLAKMLEILDVEGYDAGIEVIPVKFASAAELSKLIDTLIPGTGGAPGQPNVPRFGGGAGGRFSARRTKEGGVINTIIADERTNTLIVHANTKGADQVRELVKRLDQKVALPRGGGKIHVIYLQFADAEAIATTLNNLSSQSGPSAFRPVTPGGGGTGVNPVSASLFEGSIKISADKSTNSLVVTASPADFETISRVVSRLDIQRDEVYVEVVIMEVAINRNSEFSSGVVSPSSGIALAPGGVQDLFSFLANPALAKGAVIGFPLGKPMDVPINGQNVRVSSVMGLIKLIQTNSNSNILATPQIIALDNSEAVFDTTENIPVPQSTAIQGTVAQSVGKDKVTLSIKLTPQINKMSNFVKLKIDAKMSDIVPRDLPAQVQGLAFATLERSAQTTVVVGDTDTVVIGGLMRDKVLDTVSKVPILGDIPLLGWLFKSKKSETTKSNLLIFLTPHIVRQYEKIRTVLDNKLKERDDFLEREAGGQDTIRYKRDEMIRSLPDVKKLSQRPKTTITIDEDVVPLADEQNNPFRQQQQPQAAPSPAAPQAQPMMPPPPAFDNPAPPPNIPADPGMMMEPPPPIAPPPPGDNG